MAGEKKGVGEFIHKTHRVFFFIALGKFCILYTGIFLSWPFSRGKSAVCALKGPVVVFNGSIMGLTVFLRLWYKPYVCEGEDRLSKGGFVMNKNHQGSGRGAFARQMAQASSIGISFILAFALCVFLGYQADLWFGWHPWGKIAGVLYGVAAGVRNMWVLAKRYGGMDDHKNETPKDP
ncbi:AtpZ/AtpI family protein [Desulfurispirillum indicum]|uniref:AtpZ/AtpI family protein n=1 Tax=Desulfurispirillum indicum TaxID=936456 RepID=UPI0018DB456B|nr:AtpZ/AtpI family protein [Desulfurispirillum indicum]